MIAPALRALFSSCLLGHAPGWTYIRVNGQLTRACERCLEPLKPILADRGRDEDIQPAKVPAIMERHAQVVKAKRQRKQTQQPKLRQVK